MQLVAYRDNQAWILAHCALKGTDYRCIECDGIVRKRGGMHRRDHFYHLAPTDRCRLSGKSMAHLQVQWAILQAIPEGEALLEKRFAEIDRIADVYWEREGVVFEVQCSPISQEELLARNRAYQSLGCQVVWILHDQRFNRKRVAAAEGALYSETHYFTDIDADGQGIIYDQLALLKKGIRIKNFSKYAVDVGSPCRDAARLMRGHYLEERLKRGKLYFAGDTRERFARGEIEAQQLIAFFADEVQAGIVTRLENILQKATQLYLKIFHWMLEKVCD